MHIQMNTVSRVEVKPTFLVACVLQTKLKRSQADRSTIASQICFRCVRTVTTHHFDGHFCPYIVLVV